MKKKYFRLILFCVIIVGGALSINDNNIIKSIGESLLTGAAISLIWEYYISDFESKRNDEKNEIFLSKIDQKLGRHLADVTESITKVEKNTKGIIHNAKRLEEFEQLGLCGVYENRDYLTKNIEPLIKSANYSVKIMGESLNSFLDRPHFQKSLHDSLEKGTKMEILLSSLKSSSLDERFRELGLSKKESIGLHKKALRTYYKYCKSYSNCQMKLFVHHPKLVMVIIDDKEVFVQHYSYGMKGYEAPLYHYCNGKNDIEDFYCKIFENVWNDCDTKEAADEEEMFKK